MCLLYVVLAQMQTPSVLLAEKDVVVAAILKKWVLLVVLNYTEILYFMSRNISVNQILLFETFRCEIKQGQYVFDIPTVANSIGVTTSDLSNQLQNLKVWILKCKSYFSELFSIIVLESLEVEKIN